jgi:predicted Rossmann fold nucleotide-binding protein DprA/Smf involved in DNA uptake
MRLAIVGSRTAGPDLAQLLRAEVDRLGAPITLIVSGGARGADTLARELARERGIPLAEHLPDYHRHGRGAPLLRNKLIVDDADVVLALWDGASRGTMHTVRYAQEQGKRVVVVRF